MRISVSLIEVTLACVNSGLESHELPRYRLSLLQLVPLIERLEHAQVVLDTLQSAHEEYLHMLRQIGRIHLGLEHRLELSTMEVEQLELLAHHFLKLALRGQSLIVSRQWLRMILT